MLKKYYLKGLLGSAFLLTLGTSHATLEDSSNKEVIRKVYPSYLDKEGIAQIDLLSKERVNLENKRTHIAQEWKESIEQKLSENLEGPYYLNGKEVEYGEFRSGIRQQEGSQFKPEFDAINKKLNELGLKRREIYAKARERYKERQWDEESKDYAASSQQHNEAIEGTNKRKWPLTLGQSYAENNTDEEYLKKFVPASVLNPAAQDKKEEPRNSKSKPVRKSNAAPVERKVFSASQAQSTNSSSPSESDSSQNNSASLLAKDDALTGSLEETKSVVSALPPVDNQQMGSLNNQAQSTNSSSPSVQSDSSQNSPASLLTKDDALKGSLEEKVVSGLPSVDNQQMDSLNNQSKTNFADKTGNFEDGGKSTKTSSSRSFFSIISSGINDIYTSFKGWVSKFFS